MEDFVYIFANRLKEAREAKKLSMAKIEKATGISRAAISRYEKAAREPRIHHVKKLADYLDVPFMWLIGFEDKKSPN